jgi:hypothetical protein
MDLPERRPNGLRLLDGLREAIPPAYTLFLGEQVARLLAGSVTA